MDSIPQIQEPHGTTLKLFHPHTYMRCCSVPVIKWVGNGPSVKRPMCLVPFDKIKLINGRIKGNDTQGQHYRRR